MPSYIVRTRSAQSRGLHLLLSAPRLTPLLLPPQQVTCKDGATDDQVAAAKKHAQDQGGKITHEYNLIKGFAVEFPKDSVSTLESHEHVKAVEADKEMKTQ
ncbi:uncharacterized protein JN550_002418 [Neoarthrinium moseri]|uniref:uncharacterized protein n=1 Tax=Neoarthrinium moseri TaxID=1658444 RepID=UPI001FDE4C10|nr:uncharacterized protein JN550_002418 [Neoarthrinium moseri]KAI1874989.1 hypothetical protein JN550_002418 [Neoarthrinium moseri]